MFCFLLWTGRLVSLIVLFVECDITFFNVVIILHHLSQSKDFLTNLLLFFLFSKLLPLHSLIVRQLILVQFPGTQGLLVLVKDI